ncbi:hypothetical protein RN043_004402 [Salmonella enterica]|nr:hypothetical protein [Salmonella enterica]
MEPINNVTGCAGLRRQSLTESYSPSAGTSMSLRAIQWTGCALLTSPVCMYSGAIQHFQGILY